MSTLSGHGMSNTPVGVSWKGMVTRCYNRNTPSWRDYGARGIMICEYLRATPVNLLLLLGEKPIGMSIDRKDSDGSYTCGSCAECLAKNWPLNVRWATCTQQNRNQRDLHYLTIDGVTKCVSEWAEIKGVKYNTLRSRLRYGFTGDALFAPPLDRNSYVTIDGTTKTLKEWADRAGISRLCLFKRVRNGVEGAALLKPARRR